MSALGARQVHAGCGGVCFWRAQRGLRRPWAQDEASHAQGALPYDLSHC